MKDNVREQKLSAMRYIRNNKRRVSVLIVSLSLCLAIIYVVNYLIMSTETTAKKLFLSPTEYMCDIGITAFDNADFGLPEDYEPSKEERHDLFNQRYLEYAEMLEKDENIVKAIPYYGNHMIIKPPIAMLGNTIPLIDPENGQILLDHIGAKLIEGRLPEKPNEIIFDKATMLNSGRSIGDLHDQKFLITGIIECDFYFGYGTIGDNNYIGIKVLTKERVDDAKTLFPLIGREYDKECCFVSDNNTINNMFIEDISSQFEQATKYIYIGIFILLFISIFVVYITYLRDRHNEWCLYCSIGYSRKAIYRSIMAELLFTFITAIIAGIALTTILIFALDSLMLKPRGLYSQYFYPDKIAEILCAFVLFLGLLQIPVRYALCKIRTIDAMEDDIY